VSPQKGQLNAASYYMTQTPRVTAWAAPGRGTREHGSPRAETLTLWEHAACRGQGNEYGNVWMYPGQHDPEVVRDAVKLCASCPVRDLCAADARREAPAVGIRAGRVYGQTPDNDGRASRTCVICGDVFKGYGPAKSCSSACRVALNTHRDRVNAAAKRAERARIKELARNGPDPAEVWGTQPLQTDVRSADTLIGHTSDPGAAGNGPGSDRKPLGGPR